MPKPRETCFPVVRTSIIWWKIIKTCVIIISRIISACFGAIAGEAILGANVLKDLFASIRDVGDEVPGQANSMLMVSASGNVVRCS